MPRGGPRIGAGRKPKSWKERQGKVVGMDGNPFARPPASSSPPPADAGDLLEPPDGMTTKQAALWRQLAPYAIAQQTLVAATRAGFRELVEQMTLKAAIAEDIEKIGAAHPGSGDNLRHYAKLAQRVDATLARFRLTGSGKPEAAAARPKAAANPFAAMAAGGKA